MSRYGRQGRLLPLVRPWLPLLLSMSETDLCFCLLPKTVCIGAAFSVV